MEKIIEKFHNSKYWTKIGTAEEVRKIKIFRNQFTIKTSQFRNTKLIRHVSHKLTWNQISRIYMYTFARLKKKKKKRRITMNEHRSFGRIGFESFQLVYVYFRVSFFEQFPLFAVESSRSVRARIHLRVVNVARALTLFTSVPREVPTLLTHQRCVNLNPPCIRIIQQDHGTVTRSI